MGRREHWSPVITVTVDTGGIDQAQRGRWRSAPARWRDRRIIRLTRAPIIEQVLRFLIMGNVQRGQLYPLCVGAETRHAGTDHRAHGAPARHAHDCAWLHGRRQRSGAFRGGPAHAGAGARSARAGARSRLQAQEELAYLQKRNLPVPPCGAAYSTNRGLWGVTIGGKETLTSRAASRKRLGAHARRLPRTDARPSGTSLSFQRGARLALDGERSRRVELIERWRGLAAPFGIGRGIHLGDTIIGTKGGSHSKRRPPRRC